MDGPQAQPRLVTSTISSDVLARRLRELAGVERDVQVDFLLHLGEFDRRRAFLEAGYDSLWNYCQRALHLREGPTARRIGAMRVLRRFPALEQLLRDGRLCLSTVTMLAPLLTDENFTELTRRAEYRSKRDVAHLVASLQPRTAPRDGIRIVSNGEAERRPAAAGSTGASGAPERHDSWAPGAHSAATAGFRLDSVVAPGRQSADLDRAAVAASQPWAVAVQPSAVAGAAPPVPAAFPDPAANPDPAEFPGQATFASQAASPGQPAASGQQAASSAQMASALDDESAAAPRHHAPEAGVPDERLLVPPVAQAPRRSEVTPVSRDEWSLRVTIDAEMKAGLETLQSLLSHKSGGNLAAVLREAIRCAIEKHGKRKGAVSPAKERARGRSAPRSDAADRAIPAAVRREVWRRDQGCCQWKGKDGRRCGSKWKLEIDHVTPVARGGRSVPENLRILCRSHNALHAEQVFGRRHMSKFAGRAAPRRTSVIPSSATPPSPPPTPPPRSAPSIPGSAPLPQRRAPLFPGSATPPQRHAPLIPGSAPPPPRASSIPESETAPTGRVPSTSCSSDPPPPESPGTRTTTAADPPVPDASAPRPNKPPSRATRDPP